MNIRYSKESDKKQIIELWNYCFEDDERFVDYYFSKRYKNENTILVEEDEILSSIQLNKHKIKLRDNEYEVSYVVGVSSKPEIRGLGYMKKLMVSALEDIYKKGEILSILMAIDYRLYKRYGFAHCYDQIQYNIKTEEFAKFKLTSKLKRATLDDAELLSKIYNEAMKGLNGYAIRDKKYFESFIKEIECENGRIYINEEAEKKGYIVYYIQGDTFYIRELIYNSIVPLKNILAFIYNHNTQCKNTVINAAVDDKVKFIVDNLKTCDIKVVPFMTGRVINFQRYLETLTIDCKALEKINGKGIKIKVLDKYIKANEGVFNILIKDNKITVDKLNDEATSIILDINSIAQLVFSYLSVEEVFMLNDIDISSISDDELELLNVLFEKKQNYIDELV